MLSLYTVSSTASLYTVVYSVFSLQRVSTAPSLYTVSSQRLLFTLCRLQRIIHDGGRRGGAAALFGLGTGRGDGGGDEDEEVSAPDIEALTHIDKSVFTLPVPV